MGWGFFNKSGERKVQVATVGFRSNVSGGWSSSNPANATSSVAFTVPRTGTYLCGFSASCYTGTAALMTLTVHLNGSSSPAITIKHFFNSTSFHAAFPTQVEPISLTEGTNYWHLKQAGTGVASDLNDFASFWGVLIQ